MIEELSLENKFWPILALDHGLTVGHEDSVSITNLPIILDDCKENIGAVVKTYGLARVTSSYNELPLIIQCFGAPLGHPKVQVCSIGQALSVGAKGVAVQIDYSLPEDILGQQLKSISKLIGRAHEEKLPVLFMIAPQEKYDFSQLSQSIRFCIELGADLIKVRCNLLSLGKEDLSGLSALINGSPPLLLAGGSANTNILHEVSAAKNLGFSGYCIGRNIFQADSPATISRKLRESWQN